MYARPFTTSSSKKCFKKVSKRTNLIQNNTLNRLPIHTYRATITRHNHSFQYTNTPRPINMIVLYLFRQFTTNEHDLVWLENTLCVLPLGCSYIIYQPGKFVSFCCNVADLECTHTHSMCTRTELSFV